MKKKQCAIVTLVLGQKIADTFRVHFYPGWREYADRHDLGLVVVNCGLDASPRGLSRSPAWQKLLVHNVPEARAFERLAWVDADVMIRPDAPNIFTAVPEGKVGAVDDFATPTEVDHDLVMRELYRRWDRQGVKYISNRTATEYYANYGIECHLTSVVQTGVLVYEPLTHGPLFENVYSTYEEGAHCSLNHEMRPLSYELLKAQAVHWLDPKFNMQWSYWRELHYPFLGEGDPRPFGALFGSRSDERLRRRCVMTALRNNYFIHFAGRSRDYLLLDRR